MGKPLDLREAWKANPGGQEDYARDLTSEVKCGSAGNRGGKTYILVRGHLWRRMKNRVGGSYLPGLIVVPSFRDFDSTVKPELMAAARQAGLRPEWKRMEGVVLYHRLRSDYGEWPCSFSIIKSAEKPDSIKNFEVSDFDVEEAGHIRERPDDTDRCPMALTPTRLSLEAPINQGCYIGTQQFPGNPIDRWFDSCDAHEDHPGKLPPGHAFYRWGTAENAQNLIPGYAARVAKAIPSRMLGAILRGERPTSGGSRACPEFSPMNVDREAVYNPSLPVLLTVDWNVEPMIWGISQFTGRGVETRAWIISELVAKTNANVEKQAKRFLGWLDAIGHRGDVHVNGDPSNPRTTTHHETQRKMLRRVLLDALGDRLKMRIRNHASPQTGRLFKLNCMFDAGGVPHVFVNPDTAPEHARDFERCLVDPDGQLVKDTSGPGKERTHALDGFAEWAFDTWPDARDMMEVKGRKKLNQPRGRMLERLRNG